VLLQDVDRMSSGVEQVRIYTHVGDESNLAEFRIALNQSLHGHSLHAPHDELGQIALLCRWLHDRLRSSFIRRDKCL
jgi:hypothetical protein